MQQKKNHDFLGLVLLIILSIIIPLIILTFVIINNDDQELNDVIKYATLHSNIINTDLYNTKEISHLNDVRIFFFIIWTLLVADIFSILLLRKTIQVSFKRYFVMSLGLILALILLTQINFHFSFVAIHYILFPQGNWEFIPNESAMIQLFPESLFVNFINLYVVIYCTIQIVLFAIVKVSIKLKLKKGISFE